MIENKSINLLSLRAMNFNSKISYSLKLKKRVSVTYINNKQKKNLSLIF
jgi:hypothetical protein